MDTQAHTPKPLSPKAVEALKALSASPGQSHHLHPSTRGALVSRDLAYFPHWNSTGVRITRAGREELRRLEAGR